MAGTQVVIDLANSPSFEDKAVLEFFEIPLAITFSRRRPQRTSGTMSHYQSSQSTGQTMASWRLPARNERHSMKSSPAI